jgi:ribosome-binding protein aMBF1 (putative translation factor)
MQSSYHGRTSERGLLVACSKGGNRSIFPLMTKEPLHGGPLHDRHHKIMRTFAARLKVAREARYSSAEQFAHLLVMEPHTYRKYERGASEPNYETLTRICALLGITPNDLLPDAAGDRSRHPSKAGKRRKAA